MKNTWNRHAVSEYHSALKRKGMLTRAATWMELEGTALSEISQAPKDKDFMIPTTGDS